MHQQVPCTRKKIISFESRLNACCKLAPTLARQMWRHNYVIDRKEYLIFTLSESVSPCVYSLQFLFKSTNNLWRYERKCEWVFFLNTVYNNMGWLGDGSHRGQGCGGRYPPQSPELSTLSESVTIQLGDWDMMWLKTGPIRRPQDQEAPLHRQHAQILALKQLSSVTKWRWITVHVQYVIIPVLFSSGSGRRGDSRTDGWLTISVTWALYTAWDTITQSLDNTVHGQHTS